MTSFNFIIQSFRHYFKANLAVAIGIAVTAAVLMGALMVGDSVNHSLEQTVRYRLGSITHTISTSDRYVSKTFADDIKAELAIPLTAVLKQEATASANGGQLRIPKVNVWGIDADFNEATGANIKFEEENTVVISENLAQRLNIQVGDEILLRIEKASLVPLNAPFVSGDIQTEAFRAKVGAVLSKYELGRLSMQNSQTAPFNVFVPIEQLSNLMEIENRVNLMLLNDQNTNIEQIETSIANNFTISDASLKLDTINATGEWQLSSERVFIENQVTNAVINNIGGKPILTYFANSISFNNSTTPYSFVSSLPDEELDSSEIIINEWLANDLNVDINDTIELAYFEIGPLRKLIEKKDRFTVKEIVPLEGTYNDQQLMPYIPGFSDANNCRDWDTGVPIELKAIRDQDEDYWYYYRGTPKAFVAQSTAEKLWSNRFGNATSIRFLQEEIAIEELQNEIQQHLNPFNFDIQINPVRENGLHAANNGSDFGELFIGLSFFILLAGFLLTSMLFKLNLEQRSTQIGTLRALGISNQKINILFLTEIIFVAIVGIVIGAFLSVAYNKAVFWALNQVWHDIVRTNVLEPVITGSALINGGIITLLISGFTGYFTIRTKIKTSVYSIQRKQLKTAKSWVRKLKQISAIGFSILAIALVAIELQTTKNLNAANFFLAGGLLLIAGLLVADTWIRKSLSNSSTRFNIAKLIRKNIALNPARSLTVILLLSIGTFLTVSTGLNRKDLFATANLKTSGTGGFQFYAESTIPILYDLNDEAFRNKQGFETTFSVVPFRVAEGDDASCLNLNLISNPRIIACDASLLVNRFSLQTAKDVLVKDHPWMNLQTPYDDVIPALADQTVIQWGLGKKVGDTLTYKNSVGEEINLLLIGGLKGSIFQGSVLIDQEYFLRNFPASSGANVFLIDAEEESANEVAEELQMTFRDFGWQSTPTAQRLAEFKSIENTYLSIFLVLGAFGLLIGTIGLAVVLVRNMLERKSELALLSSIGFEVGKIIRIVFTEYAVLFSYGVTVGFITAIISTLPALLNNSGGASFQFPLILIGIIILNGIVWILMLSTIQLKRMKLVESLRNE